MWHLILSVLPLILDNVQKIRHFVFFTLELVLGPLHFPFLAPVACPSSGALCSLPDNNVAAPSWGPSSNPPQPALHVAASLSS